MPVKFTPEWDEIYENIFSTVLSRFEFKRIKEISQMRIKRRL